MVLALDALKVRVLLFIADAKPHGPTRRLPPLQPIGIVIPPLWRQFLLAIPNLVAHFAFPSVLFDDRIIFRIALAAILNSLDHGAQSLTLIVSELR